ncbi:hypothetical protein [Nonomuraea sediminis]|uniref:hypothetical protein n=1 Tax=Nonomuraea sediminis TaxID=2835864 RepID=UPI001BDC9413|nr:hypothetical protein [Nonomuraea sediminis]
MDVEAQILDLLSRVQTLEGSVRAGDSSMATVIGIAQLMTDISEMRTELRQDLGALSDELAGLRRHMNEQLNSILSELQQKPDPLEPEPIN